MNFGLRRKISTRSALMNLNLGENHGDGETHWRRRLDRKTFSYERIPLMRRRLRMLYSSLGELSRSAA
ncbi:hypothetical protein OESDEN_20222 [Oesophagostomum dentatum]|uniref:Uncharacterized protein n=1 Tax=Oesophagostomum dentatum TaxID=61180 RepID=A0A0B1S897_OESDE|nr:hypothetical protein OESDEN_20222 [Oesophagostomum dentatum]